MEDPFFVVKEEVEKAILNVNDLHSRWRQLITDPNTAGKEETTFTQGKIRNSIKSIQWDLEDLTDTVSAVEENPMKFNLTQNEVEERRSFIKHVKSKLQTIEGELSQEEGRSKSRGGGGGGGRSSLLGGRSNKNKYERLDNDMMESNDRFINDQYQQQKLLVRQQEDQLDQVRSP